MAKPKTIRRVREPVDLPKHFEALRTARLTPAFARLMGTISPAATKVPSMMSMLEKRLLFNLARNYYAGEGVIIDAGIFLGASTVCFGEGIRKNVQSAAIRTRWAKPIVALELGIINPGMPAFFKRHNVEGMDEPGGSFSPTLERNIGPVADLVDLRLGDIRETAADISSPVEILFLDVLKLPEISRFAIRQFFPRLIPGRSIIIQQDYFIDLLPFIRTDQEFFADYFTYIGEVCSSALFLCTKAIPESEIVRLEAGIAAQEQERMASVAMQRSTDPARRFMMAISKVRLMRQLYGNACAQEYLRFVKKEFPDQVASHLPRLKEALASIERLCCAGAGDSTSAGSINHAPE